MINITKDFIDILRRIMGLKEVIYLSEIIDINQQVNGVDCGIYVLKNILITEEGNYECAHSPADIKELRHAVYSIIMDQGELNIRK